MKKRFDWNKFKTENIAVHCKTLEEAERFCTMTHIYCNDDPDDTYWTYYKEDTCYVYNRVGRMYCGITWYKDHGYTILEFSDYFAEEPSHYGEININGDCFIVKERDECSNPEWMYLCDLFGLDYDATERIVIDGVVKYFGLRKDEV